MPRLSIYLQDDLLERVKASHPDANLSQVVQAALVKMLGDDRPKRPRYARRPADAEEEEQRARDALEAAAYEDFRAGYHVGLRRAAELPWGQIDRLSDLGFDLHRWLDPWVQGLQFDAVHGRVEVPEWFTGVSEDLGDMANPFGHDIYSHHRSKAFCGGYSDALRAQYEAVAEDYFRGTEDEPPAEEPPLVP